MQEHQSLEGSSGSASGLGDNKGNAPMRYLFSGIRVLKTSMMRHVYRRVPHRLREAYESYRWARMSSAERATRFRSESMRSWIFR